MMLSCGAAVAMTLTTLLALIQSARLDARIAKSCAWKFLASLVSLTAGRACMPTAWINAPCR